MYSDDLKKMQKAQLIFEAEHLGIEVGPKESKAKIIEKIEKAYYMTEEGKKELKELVPAPVLREDGRQRVHYRGNHPIGIDSVIKSEDIDNEIIRTKHDLQASGDSSILLHMALLTDIPMRLSVVITRLQEKKLQQ